MIILHKGRDEILCNGLSHHEFWCKCSNESCTMTLVNEDLIEAFEAIRTALGAKIVVTSGYRCQLHNSKQAGHSQTSRHCAGMAIDFANIGKIATMTYDQVKEMADKAGFNSMYFNKEKNFYHFQI